MTDEKTVGKKYCDEVNKLLEEKTEWTTNELTRDFEVIAFCAPFVVVKRRSDSVEGSLQFDHRPRRYYNWAEHTSMRRYS